MGNSLLLKICALGAIIGIAGIWFFSGIGVATNDIENLKNASLERSYKVSGNVTKMFISNKGHVFLEISDKNDKINAIVFNNTALKIGAYKINKNTIISFSGVLKEYKGKKEIIIDILY